MKIFDDIIKKVFIVVLVEKFFETLIVKIADHLGDSTGKRICRKIDIKEPIICCPHCNKNLNALKDNKQ